MPRHSPAGMDGYRRLTDVADKVPADNTPEQLAAARSLVTRHAPDLLEMLGLKEDA